MPKYYGKKKVYKSTKKVGGLAKVQKQVTNLKKLVHPEFKHFDDSTGSFASPIAVTEAGLVDCLNLVPGGDTEQSRVSNSIRAKYISINGSLNWDSVAVEPQTIRIALVRDYQTIADSYPTWGTIFDVSSPNTHLSLTSLKRFKILKQWTVVLSSQNPRQAFQWRKRLDHEIRFNGTAAGDTQKGNLYLVYLGSQVTENYPSITYRSRLTYTDS